MAITKKAVERHSNIKVVSGLKTGADLWEDAPTEFDTRVSLLSAWGDTGTGRSTLALTAPGPIAYLHAAEKIKGIVEPFAREKKIKLHGFAGVFTGSPQEISDQASAVWNKFKRMYYDAYSWARTIVIDTDTELWELLRLVYFGALKPESGRIDANWGPPNAEWRSLFKSFRAQDRTNLIVLGQAKDEYKVKKNANTGKDGMGERTGRLLRAGQKEVPYFSDVMLEMTKEDGTFMATVRKGWFRAEVEGDVFVDRDINFAGIMAAITETKSKEWR